MIEKVLMNVHLPIIQIIIGIVIIVLLKKIFFTVNSRVNSNAKRVHENIFLDKEYTQLSYQHIEVHNGN